MREFSMSGTLGDAFIVFCKLNEYAERTGEDVTLYRYSRHPDFDDLIEALFAHSDRLSYHRPCLEPGDVNGEITDPVAPYVNVFWDGKGAEGYPDDPDGIRMDPFPEMNIDRRELTTTFDVGIQLHTGKPGSNFKGLSLGWISDVRAELPADEYTIHLYGTGDGYSPREYKRLGDREGIQNHVGETDFNEWLQHLVSLDYYIEPEGFSGFFSMSQRIPSLMFYRNEEILLRVPPDWRREHTICRLETSTSIGQALGNLVPRLLHQNCRFRPLPPSQIRGLLNVETKYI
jgi:hypothetical protein